ncbi:MAG TPA: pilus assembly protein PilM [Vicinamibacterales bacterium]|nr:pilus assembly protein PilM [Vicinamibacterales bacterium]
MMFRDWLSTPPPDVAVEIDRTHVAAARLTWRGSQAVIAAHASEPLAPGLVTPGLAALNLSDVPVVAQAISRALAQLGGRTTRVSLIVPDTVAKVSLLKLDNVPARAADLQEIVRWQVRKTAPFPIEQAIVSITPGARAADGAAEFVVALARPDVIHQYEQACLMAGAHAGLVDISTFGALNGILAAAAPPAGDWLLVHVTDTYSTLVVMREQSLLFFRTRDNAEGTLADLIHQTAMYYEDRLHGFGFSRVMIAGAARLPGGADQVRRGLEERLQKSVEAVDPRATAALQDRIGASPELLDVLAPLVGLLMRDRKAA